MAQDGVRKGWWKLSQEEPDQSHSPGTHPRHLSLYLTYGTSTSTPESHLLHSTITLRFSYSKFKIFSYVARNLFNNRHNVCNAVSCTQRSGVLWGMAPFREFSGKKLFEVSSKLI